MQTFHHLLKMGSEYGTSVLVATGIVFIILPVVAVGLRFYARSLVRAKLGGDDWVMIPALVSRHEEWC